MAKGQVRSNKEKKKPKKDKAKGAGASSDSKRSQTNELFRAVDAAKTPSGKR